MNAVPKDPMIVVSNVRKSFGPVHAVDGIDLTIGTGEFFALLGPSGCGKTTLLRMLAGFEAPTSGEIYIDGEGMATVPPNLRPTNMVFQSYAIFPHLNVRQNIGYGLLKKGLSRTEIRSRVDEMLELTRLPGLGSRAATQLSGGQRQRVALARALICRPKVLLLDEPLGALDKQLREEMQIELRQIQRSVGITFVFVTHDQEEALAMADRVAMMSAGKVAQVGTASDLYERPVSTEVARFVGTINLFPGQVREVRDHATVDAGAAGMIVVPTGGRTVRAGDKVVVAVRPEKMSLDDGDADVRSNAVTARVLSASYVGDRTYYHLELANAGQRLAVASLNRSPVNGGALNAGQEMRVTWPHQNGILLQA